MAPDLAGLGGQTNGGDMKNEILAYIKGKGNVSFAELSKDIDGFNGDMQMRISEEAPSGPKGNVILWTGISAAAAAAIVDLIAEKKICSITTNWLTYLADGTALSLPLVKGNYHYKKPHWLPVVFNLYPKVYKGGF